MARFVGIPEVPTAGLQDFQAQLFGAMKENIELLIGSRGEIGSSSSAVTRGDIRAALLGVQRMHTVNTIGPEGYNISSRDVASLVSHRGLRDDVQLLANDLVNTRETVDLIIRDLKGT